ncbi:MAG TPA: hypothetical protein PLV92_10050, partial [Pirellulaceae bacterium]|nr:hypothetical protein [Pirellulaceae bacterium]
MRTSLARSPSLALVSRRSRLSLPTLLYATLAALTAGLAGQFDLRSSRGAEPTVAASNEPLVFERHIRPLLKANC